MVAQMAVEGEYGRDPVPDCEDAVYDPALLSRRFRLPTNVRLWLEADIQPHPELRPLSPRKRTFARQSKKVCL